MHSGFVPINESVDLIYSAQKGWAKIMLQNLIEHRQLNCMVGELVMDSQRKAIDEMNAREKMVADRREQQRLHILRNLLCRH